MRHLALALLLACHRSQDKPPEAGVADCGDREPTAEICDFVDNDCDGQIDEDDAEGVVPWYADLDGDGYGVEGYQVDRCQAPDGWVGAAGDCDDADAGVHPSAEEVCDGVDQDCDDVVDDDAIDPQTWYMDADADGYGLSDQAVTACFAPTGYAALDGDCDDGDLYCNPGADEICNDRDDDCDGDIDLNPVGGEAWFEDSDADGFGDDDTRELRCEGLDGWVEVGGDCAPDDPEISPSAVETCNEVDDNCDDTVDNYATDAPDWYMDSDGDGAGDPSAPLDYPGCGNPGAASSEPDDCDDTDAEISPTASELCGDGVDQDCDGVDPDC